MRSWATLQPGEYFGCIGCHEPKRGALPPDARNVTAAMKKPAQTLKPFANGTKEHPLVKRLRTEKWYASVDNFLGVNAARSTDPDAPTDGFSFRREIQPILDRNCTRCHDATHPKLDLTGAPFPDDKVWPISKNYYNPTNVKVVRSEVLDWLHNDMGIWPFDVIDFKSRHEEDGKPVADTPAFDIHNMSACSSAFRPFEMKCMNSIYVDRVRMGGISPSDRYSFVEGRIAVLNSWQERPIMNVVDCELYAGPVFNNLTDYGIATVWTED
jgi:hypothetical protein